MVSGEDHRPKMVCATASLAPTERALLQLAPSLCCHKFSTMSSSSSNNKDTQPDYDPYKVLGIPMDASSAAIAKAFRKASVKYHPDKQHAAVMDETHRAQLAAQFQQLQDARDVLQDPTKRQKYDAQRASLLARQAADRAREQHMTAQRKRLREQLAQQEEEQAARAKKQQQRPSSSPKSATRVDALRTQGQQLREQYAARQEAAAWRAAHTTATEAQQQQPQQQSANDDGATSNLEDRQVRLKWSRKKLSISPSEDSLAHLLQPLFGAIEHVEFLGTKGNLALVTFAARESCTPCVKYYQQSDEMRATYVGARKETEARKQSQAAAAKQQKEAPQSPSARATKTTAAGNEDHESVDAYKLRRAAEREALLRKMELEEAAATTSVEETTTNTTSQSTKSSSSSKKANTTADTTTSSTPISSFVFPPDFPHTAEYAACQSPYEKLLVAESQILTKILSSAGSTD